MKLVVGELCFVPFIPSSVCAPFGALHISVALPKIALSDESAGVIQEGVYTGAFCFLCFFLPHLPPAVLAFIFIARRGSAVPFPRRQ